MKLSDVVSGAGLALYAEVALLLFFIVFLAVAVRLMITRRERYEHMAQLPLEDEPPSRTETHGAPGRGGDAAAGGGGTLQASVRATHAG
jgi:cbb3-type cytochrome oxidase subunit 3